MAEQVISLEAIAKLLSLDPRRVQQLAKEGVIPKAARGQYPLVGSVRGYIQYLQSLAYGSAGAEQTGYGLERTRLTRVKAELQEIELQRRRQEVVLAQEVEETWGLMIMRMKSKLSSIPNRLAQRVRATRTNAQAKEIIKKAIDEGLRELSETEIESP